MVITRIQGVDCFRFMVIPTNGAKMMVIPTIGSKMMVMNAMGLTLSDLARLRRLSDGFLGTKAIILSCFVLSVLHIQPQGYTRCEHRVVESSVKMSLLYLCHSPTWLTHNSASTDQAYR
jgi:hypothetical protein